MSQHRGTWDRWSCGKLWVFGSDELLSEGFGAPDFQKKFLEGVLSEDETWNIKVSEDEDEMKFWNIKVEKDVEE